MIIIIPAYNPNYKLISLINEIKRSCNYHILIVNDGSKDSCGRIFTQAELLGCTLLVHNHNKGKGAALKTAFSYIQEKVQEQEGIVCADCDGQHTVTDIMKIAEMILLNKENIILGCREFNGNVPKKSLFGNTLTRIILRMFNGMQIDDTQTGLRGFSINMLPWLISIRGDRYEYEMYQLLQAKSKGYQFVCIPIQTIYENNNKGSHFSPIKDSIKVYLPILKFGLSSIICAIIDFVALFILKGLTNQLFISVVCSRIISSICNFEINRNVVFQTEETHVKVIVKYFGLVTIILICNYILMYLFTSIFLFSLFLSKILTESILFVFSYLLQKAVVFDINIKNNNAY